MTAPTIVCSPVDLTLRDWFAGQALGAMISEYLIANKTGVGADHLYRNLPTHAYRMADAMIAARGAA